MKFGLIANLKRAGADEAVRLFVQWAETNGHQSILSEDLAPVATSHKSFSPAKEIASQVDVLVSMGGDGTLISSARAVGTAETPLLGINLGSLGFLTQQRGDQLVSALQRIVSGNYRIEERMLLKVDTNGSSKKLSEPYALNDVVINHGPVSRVITINLKANDQEVVTFTGDGMIIATPTGSTAYSLAVGGPIVYPTMDAMIAAPISPFALTMRPIIFPATERLTLRMVSEGRTASLTLDGQIMSPITDSDVITITLADFKSRFISFPENSFYSVLRRKLNLGVLPQGDGV
ncbi:MAG: NAD(+)/NADH kinase [candidate division Zixibacteria bacterium]|nr:NAD(+)/NADH kinase [candidate division Zixibacteria bacterium]